MNYLTACRKHELPVLLGSMLRHCKPFVLHVLCWDWTAPILAHGIDGEFEVRYIKRAEFLAQHPEYEKLPGPPRKTINHIDTARWRVMTDLLANGRGPLMHIDGDQWFFSSPAALLDEVAGAKLAVSPHRIPSAADGLPGVTLETHRKYGLYNSGLIYVADAEIAEEMARAVFDWSHSEPKPVPDGTHLFGDQGHLERIATRTGAHVIRHPGVNVAPWNANRYTPSVRAGQVYVDDSPLVTYHFSSLRWERGNLMQLADPAYCLPASYLLPVYEPYLAALAGARVSA